MIFTEHVITEMDETMVQHCVKCGEVISDYRFAVWSGPSAPLGYSAGSVYMSSGNPRITTTIISGEDIIVDCMKRNK